MKLEKCKIKKCPCNKSDDWYINSPEYGNCFWNYLTFNTHPHTLSEISDLLGISISAITSIEKKSVRKLRKSLSHLKQK